MEGPVDIPVGATPNSHPGGVSGWNGMTIKDILEKVDLFNITSLVDDDYQKVKDTKPPCTMSDTKDEKSPMGMQQQANSAFLGPKIWKKPLFATVSRINNTMNTDSLKKVCLMDWL